jgi:hypothetical protein
MRDAKETAAEMKRDTTARMPRAGVKSLGYKHVMTPFFTTWVARSPVGCKIPRFKAIRRRCQHKKKIWLPYAYYA